ncbi:MAG: hypothetical protein U0975_04585 [Erythrobacter sp.]|nr:hypothetical protein [Erythrobacter sp.]MDZ4271929.1 hypothetical protein [Erythrobacter sp.]
MDEASGEGWVELQDGGPINGEVSFHDGDESSFVATRWISSTAC